MTAEPVRHEFRLTPYWPLLVIVTVMMVVGYGLAAPLVLLAGQLEENDGWLRGVRFAVMMCVAALPLMCGLLATMALPFAIAQIVFRLAVTRFVRVGPDGLVVPGLIRSRTIEFAQIVYADRRNAGGEKDTLVVAWGPGNSDWWMVRRGDLSATDYETLNTLLQTRLPNAFAANPPAGLLWD